MKGKKGISNKKRFFRIFLVILIGFLGYYLKHAGKVLTAYNAKNLCSCVFVAGRNPQHVMENELGNFPQSLASMEVDNSEGSVTATVFGLFEKKAYFREGLGCTLLNGTSIQELVKQGNGFNRSKPDSLQPLQNFVADSFPALKVDIPLLQKVLTQDFQKTSKKQTRAVVVMYDSLLVTEKYADGFGKQTPLMGWSMTKSITATLLGMLVKDSVLSLEQKGLFKEWKGNEDPRKEISLDQMLRMSSGLQFQEEYFLVSDATKMLFDSYSVSTIPMGKELAYAPGTHWSYSSGTSNLLSQLVRNQFENQQAYWNFPYDSLFNPIGITTMTMEPDPSGTFVGSSYSYATARDWARLGVLYLKNGKWNGKQILPENWAKYVSTVTPTSTGGCYGAHFWMDAGNSSQEKSWKNVPKDAYYMSGFEGQTVMIIPSKKLVIVRLSYSKAGKDDLGQFVSELLKAFKEIELPREEVVEEK